MTTLGEDAGFDRIVFDVPFVARVRKSPSSPALKPLDSIAPV